MNARRKLLESLDVAPAAPKPVALRLAVPPRFVENFELVADHYGLKAQGEYETAKAAARADLESAITTFAALSNEIRQEQKAA